MAINVFHGFRYNCKGILGLQIPGISFLMATFSTIRGGICEADMTFIGLICSYFKAYEIENKDWISVTGVIKIAYDEVMKRNVPVCRITELEKTHQPKNETISLI